MVLIVMIAVVVIERYVVGVRLGDEVELGSSPLFRAREIHETGWYCHSDAVE